MLRQNELAGENASMQLVILPGTYHGWNLGDMAMLIIAIQRLRKLWPKSQITVLTYETEPFKKLCPEVQLFSLQERDAWLNSPSQGGEKFVRLIKGADLFLMTGCGAINDIWRENALNILQMFEYAVRLGVPTAMMGQGIGPLHDPELLAMARCVFPQVDLIGLRDTRSRELLISKLGVDEGRIRITGDDASELAYQERPAQLGGAIGVNFRVADYSEISGLTASACATVLAQKAVARGGRLLGLPISHFRGESDGDSLRQAFGVASNSFDDGAKLDTPLKIIQQTRECRVVVTVSYHAAVFALAMGIPAIGIVQSDYYRQKFDGLVHFFGQGCAVVDGKCADPASEIERQFDRMWDDAPALRDSLIAAAADQVAKGEAAYRSLLSGKSDYSMAPR